MSARDVVAPAPAAVAAPPQAAPSNKKRPRPAAPPFHFLMDRSLKTTTSSSNQDGEETEAPPPPLNIELNDVITKRAKKFQLKPPPGGSSAETPTDEEQPPSIWFGVTKVERDLLSCCEEPNLHKSLSVTEVEQDERFMKGSLHPDKEVKFVGLLARDCNDMATRSLAVAILERTINRHLYETEPPGEYRESDDEDDGDDDSSLEDAGAQDIDKDDVYRPDEED